MTLSPGENSPYDSGVIPVVPKGGKAEALELRSLRVAASSNF